MDTRSNFLEKSKSAVSEMAGNRFKVILLSEGLGNLGDAYFYTKEALASAVSAFEGSQCMVDHPSVTEEHDRPERSVKDIAGHYENVMVEEIDGRSHLTGELALIEGESLNWVREQLKHAIKYSQKYQSEDFIGLSINASGDADEVLIDDVIKIAAPACMDKLLMAKENGISVVKMTRKIDSAVSCDLVTHAGAGGRVIKMLEQEKNKMGKNKQAEPKDPTHDDEDKDIALIKSMLDKYLGDKQDKEDEQSIRQAAKAYKATGTESNEEAYEFAAKHIKAAKHMKTEADEAKKKEEESEEAKKKEAAKKDDECDTKKKEADEAKKKEEEADEAKKEAFVKKDDEDKEDEDEKKKKEAKKKEEESEENEGKKREAALLGEIAGLKAKLVEKELEEYMENQLKESGSPRSATKKFRECLVGVKSKKEFDSLFSVFKIRLESANRGESAPETSPEKSVIAEDSDKAISFANCIE